MTGFEADADRLSGHAKEFDALRQRAGEIAAELDRSLEGAESAWGDDDVGRSFASAHAAPAGETAAKVRGLADGLDGVGGSFAEAGRRYQAGDDAAADAIGG